LASQAYEAKELSRAERIIDEILRLGPYQPAQSLKNKINADKNKPVTRPLPMSAPVKPVVTAQPTSQDAEQAEQLYYEALRYYAENDWEKAVKKLHQSLALDPRNKAYQNTLEGIEAEFRNRAKEKVRR
jgi:tetratricopeptide (TPR) repeat protein